MSCETNVSDYVFALLSIWYRWRAPSIRCTISLALSPSLSLSLFLWRTFSQQKRQYDSHFKSFVWNVCMCIEEPNTMWHRWIKLTYRVKIRISIIRLLNKRRNNFVCVPHRTHWNRSLDVFNRIGAKSRTADWRVKCVLKGSYWRDESKEWFNWGGGVRENRSKIGSNLSTKGELQWRFEYKSTWDDVVILEKNSVISTASTTPDR